MLNLVRGTMDDQLSANVAAVDNCAERQDSKNIESQIYRCSRQYRVAIASPGKECYGDVRHRRGSVLCLRHFILSTWNPETGAAIQHPAVSTYTGLCGHYRICP